jgi:hypothetical protein
MARWSGVLAMTMVVRDEEDIIGANLDYHLSQGVDLILVTDHASTDGTPEVLARYASRGQVRVDREEGASHDQVARVNRLLRKAAETHRADWVIHCDADEFWMPSLGSLRDVFAAVPSRFGYLQVKRTNFVPLADDSRPFYERMVVREASSLNLRGDPLEPKVAQRPAAASGVLPGNHDLQGPVMEVAPDIGAVAVGHFPIRSFEQFEKKVVNTGTGYERLQGRKEGVGMDQLELLRRQRAGELREHYEAQVLDGPQLDRAFSSGKMVIDERVREVLAGDPVEVAHPARLEHLLRSMWLLAGSSRDQQLAAEEETRQKEARVAQLHGEVRELDRQIREIQDSRIMRYTASARRLYYRVRR